MGDDRRLGPILPRPSEDRTALGIVVILATVFTMSLVDAIVKFFSAIFPLWQIYVVRSLIAIPIMCCVSFVGWRSSIRPESIRWTMLRSMLLALMYIAIYAGIPILSLSVIAASLYTGPLFITLLSAVWIREAVGLTRWLAIGLGFLGVIIIIRPGSDAFNVATLIPVGAALLYAVAAIITRTKCAGERPLVLALGLNYALLAVGLTMSATIAVLHPSPIVQASYPFLLGSWVAMGPKEWGVITVRVRPAPRVTPPS